MPTEDNVTTGKKVVIGNENQWAMNPAHPTKLISIGIYNHFRS